MILNTNKISRKIIRVVLVVYYYFSLGPLTGAPVPRQTELRHRVGPGLSPGRGSDDCVFVSTQSIIIFHITTIHTYSMMILQKKTIHHKVFCTIDFLEIPLLQCSKKLIFLCSLFLIDFLPSMNLFPFSRLTSSTTFPTGSQYKVL